MLSLALVKALVDGAKNRMKYSASPLGADAWKNRQTGSGQERCIDFNCACYTAIPIYTMTSTSNEDCHGNVQAARAGRMRISCESGDGRKLTDDGRRNANTSCPMPPTRRIVRHNGNTVSHHMDLITCGCYQAGRLSTGHSLGFRTLVFIGMVAKRNYGVFHFAGHGGVHTRTCVLD